MTAVFMGWCKACESKKQMSDPIFGFSKKNVPYAKGHCISCGRGIITMLNKAEFYRLKAEGEIPRIIEKTEGRENIKEVKMGILGVSKKDMAAGMQEIFDAVKANMDENNKKIINFLESLEKRVISLEERSGGNPQDLMLRILEEIQKDRKEIELIKQSVNVKPQEAETEIDRIRREVERYRK